MRWSSRIVTSRVPHGHCLEALIVGGWPCLHQLRAVLHGLLSHVLHINGYHHVAQFSADLGNFRSIDMNSNFRTKPQWVVVR